MKRKESRVSTLRTLGRKTYSQDVFLKEYIFSPPSMKITYIPSWKFGKYKKGHCKQVIFSLITRDHHGKMHKGQKVKDEWIRDWNVKYKTIKLLKDHRENLDYLEYGKGSLDITPKAQTMKEIIDSWVSLKLKTSALQKTLSREWEDKPRTGRKYLQRTYLIKDSYLKCINIFWKLNNKKPNNSTKKMDLSLKIQTTYYMTSTIWNLEKVKLWSYSMDHKEDWQSKNWCFWTVVLEKTLKSPLDCKEI